jgi:cell division ATPase FtsA
MGIPLDNITGNNPDVEKPEYATALGLLLGAPGQVSKENEPMVIKEVSEEELKTESSKKTVTDTTENKKQETGWFSRLSKKYTSDKKPTSKDEGSFGTNLKEIWKNLKRIGHEL